MPPIISISFMMVSGFLHQQTREKVTPESRPLFLAFFQADYLHQPLRLLVVLSFSYYSARNIPPPKKPSLLTSLALAFMFLAVPRTSESW